MRVLIATDKFKGSLTQRQATDAIAEGVRRASPAAAIDLCPLADGGEGTVRCVVDAAGGRCETLDVCGPLPGMRVAADIGWIDQGRTAVIELASAAGLQLVPPEKRDPMRTTTFGVGELLRTAADRGATKIILGVGGSATCDAGIGIAQAWGGMVRMTTGKTYGAGDRRLCGGDLGGV
ncbi:MAG TPA: glycerate kinase, partial [Tepidisphaeraceae bacterium]